MNKILVTGGLGYIGSHTCVALMEAGYHPVIIDNLSNCDTSVFDRIKRISNRDCDFIEGDIRNTALLSDLMAQHTPSAVMHFAGLKAVGESAEKPLDYYQNNVEGTLCLLDAMKANDVKHLIFSSSATVYGTPSTLPITENMPTGQTTNPYGRSKYMIEEILKDMQAANQDWIITLLRYFNPVGAHESGIIGEDPQGIPNNLVPYIAKVATGELPAIQVFGDDYDTVDGTGVRDYIHVLDLAAGHVVALERLNGKPGVHIYNLGTGQGTSVLDMIKAYEAACGKPLPYTIAPRRAGDIDACWADASKAKKDLNWFATRSVNDMVRDSWNWVNK